MAEMRARKTTSSDNDDFSLLFNNSFSRAFDNTARSRSKSSALSTGAGGELSTGARLRRMFSRSTWIAL